MTQPTCEQRIDKELETEKEYLYWLAGDEPDSETTAECGMEPDRYGDYDVWGWYNERALAATKYTIDEFEGWEDWNPAEDEREPEDWPHLHGCAEHGPDWFDSVIVVELSTGGPADGFVAFIGGNHIIRLVYYFQDWFDGAQRAVSDKKAIAGMGAYLEPMIDN